MGIAGHIDLSRDAGGLLREALPVLIHVRGDALIGQLLEELTGQRLGAAVAMDHIAQLVFVQVLRVSLADPAHPWRLAELAQAAALSRTAFAVRFRDVVGVPPLTYLLKWRMNLAAAPHRGAGPRKHAARRPVVPTDDPPPGPGGQEVNPPVRRS